MKVSTLVFNTMAPSISLALVVPTLQVPMAAPTFGVNVKRTTTDLESSPLLHATSTVSTKLDSNMVNLVTECHTIVDAPSSATLSTNIHEATLMVDIPSTRFRIQAKALTISDDHEEWDGRYLRIKKRDDDETPLMVLKLEKHSHKAVVGFPTDNGDIAWEYHDHDISGTLPIVIIRGYTDVPFDATVTSTPSNDDDITDEPQCSIDGNKLICSNAHTNYGWVACDDLHKADLLLFDLGDMARFDPKECTKVELVVIDA